MKALVLFVAALLMATFVFAGEPAQQAPQEIPMTRDQKMELRGTLRERLNTVVPEAQRLVNVVNQIQVKLKELDDELGVPGGAPPTKGAKQ